MCVAVVVAVWWRERRKLFFSVLRSSARFATTGTYTHAFTSRWCWVPHACSDWLCFLGILHCEQKGIGPEPTRTFFSLSSPFTIHLFSDSYPSVRSSRKFLLSLVASTSMCLAWVCLFLVVQAFHVAPFSVFSQLFFPSYCFLPTPQNICFLSTINNRDRIKKFLSIFPHFFSLDVFAFLPLFSQTRHWFQRELYRPHVQLFIWAASTTQRLTISDHLFCIPLHTPRTFSFYLSC